MNAFYRLLARLHSVFNKEANEVTAIDITPPSGESVTVTDTAVTLSTGEALATVYGYDVAGPAPLVDTFTDANGTELPNHTSDSGHTWEQIAYYGIATIQSNATSGVGGAHTTTKFDVESFTYTATLKVGVNAPDANLLMFASDPAAPFSSGFALHMTPFNHVLIENLADSSLSQYVDFYPIDGDVLLWTYDHTERSHSVYLNEALLFIWTVAGLTLPTRGSVGFSCSDAPSINLYDISVAVTGAYGPSVGYVADFIDAVSGWSASVVDAATGILLARALVPDNGLEDILNCATSPLWHEMKVLGWALDEQAERIVLAAQQLYPDTAAGEWLDLWGREYLGVLRDEGEDDSAYGLRMVSEVVRPVANNLALENILEAALSITTAAVADAVVYAEVGAGIWHYGDGYHYGDAGLVYGGEPQVAQPAEEVLGYFTVVLYLPVGTTVPEETAIAAQATALVDRYKAAGVKMLSLTTTVMT